jgi:hypothetical protein
MFTVRGAGTQSCGQWIAEHRRGVGFHQDSWLMGYVSGANAFFLKSSPDISEGTDLHGMTGWMDNYCRSNPLATIQSAADALLLELLNRSKAY